MPSVIKAPCASLTLRFNALALVLVPCPLCSVFWLFFWRIRPLWQWVSCHNYCVSPDLELCSHLLRIFGLHSDGGLCHSGNKLVLPITVTFGLASEKTRSTIPLVFVLLMFQLILSSIGLSFHSVSGKAMMLRRRLITSHLIWQ